MVNAEAYFTALKDRLLSSFGARLCYLGMQGSYLRGEATESSDIDAMVILDKVDRADLALYRSVVRSMPFDVEPCGFLCSREDMAAWNPLEIGQLALTTRDVYGRLADFLPAHTRADDISYVRMGVNNLYHALVHGLVYDEPADVARALPFHAKGVFFLQQMLHLLRTGDFCPNRAALLNALPEEDRAVLALAEEIRQGESSYEAACDALLAWCQHTMQELAHLG